MRRRLLFALLVAALAVVAVSYQLRLWDWEVEDAAITFAYARSFAEGDGLVPQPGAERVEGYSNPTWLLLFAAKFVGPPNGGWPRDYTDSYRFR